MKTEKNHFFHNMCRMIGLFLIAMIGTAEFCSAATNPEDEQQRLKTLQQQLKEQQTKYEHVKGVEQSLAGELHRIDQQLKASQQKLESSRQKLTKTEDELTRAQTNLDQLHTQYQTTNDILAKRLRAIYKLGELGYLAPVLAMTTENDQHQQIIYLQQIAESDRQLLLKAKTSIQTIRKEQATLEKRKADLLQAQREIEQQNTQIGQQKKQKTELLTRIRGDKQQFAKVIQELEVSAEKLDSFLQNLEIAQKAPTDTRGTGPEVTIPTNAQDVVKSYERIFRSNKGKMLWPVQGKILTPFGNIKVGDTYTSYKGVDIQAAIGAPFYSVFQGTVIFSGWFDGYGNMVIIDHGGNFYTLYAHADELTVKTGQTVENRQILGKVGDTDSIKGPLLYFEIRANGKPENPQTWLAKLK